MFLLVSIRVPREHAQTGLDAMRYKRDARERLTAAGYKPSRRFPIAQRARADAYAASVRNATGVDMQVDEAGSL